MQLFNLGYIISLRDHFSGPLKAIEGHIEHLNETVKRTRSFREVGENMAMVGAGITAVGAGIALPLKWAVDAAAETEHALRHLGTTLPDNAGKIHDLAEATRFAEEMSVRFNTSQAAVLNNLYLGVSYGLDFRNAMRNATASMAVAKGGMGDMAEIGKSLPILFNDFGNKALAAGPQIEHFADIVAYATRHFAFANVNQLMEGVNASVGSARAAGMTFEDLITTISAFNKIGLQGSEAGTALMESLQALGKGKFEKLGIPVARFTSGAVDVAGTFMNLRKAYEGHIVTLETFEKVAHALGIRGTRAMALNLKDLEDISKEIHGSVTGAAWAGAEEMLKAYSEQMGILGQRFKNFGEVCGVQLLEPIVNLAKGLGAVVEQATKFAQVHPHVTKLGAEFAAVGAGALLTLGPAIIGLGALTASISYLLMTWAGLKIAGSGFLSLASSVWTATYAVGAFLVTNPLGWAILAAAGLAAVYVYWDRITGFFTGLWSYVKGIDWGALGLGIVKGIGYGLGAGLAGLVVLAAAPFVGLPVIVGTMLITTIGVFHRYHTQIVAGFEAMWAGVKSAGAAFLDWGAAFVGWFGTYWKEIALLAAGPLGWITLAVWKLGPTLYAAGAAMMKALGQGILDGLMWPVRAAMSVANKIKDLFVGHSPPPLGPLHELGRVRIIETIAEMIRPEPVLSAARSVAAALATALPLTFTPVMANTVPLAMPPVSAAVRVPALPAIAALTWPMLAPVGGPSVQPASLPIAARREGNGERAPRVSVQVSLTYNISGKADDSPDFRRLLDEHADHVAAIVQDKLDRAERAAY